MGVQEFRPEPEWLYKEIESACNSIRAGYDRDVAASWGDRDPFPLSWDDAERLLALMDKRFKSWTGRTIKQHIAARNE